MSAHPAVPTLPVEVRRQLWDRLWRDVLLRPPQPPPTPPQDDGARADEAA